MFFTSNSFTFKFNLPIILQTLYNIADCRAEHERTSVGGALACHKNLGWEAAQTINKLTKTIHPLILFLSFIAWPNFCMKMGGGGLKPAASAKALAPPIFMPKFGHVMKT